MEPSRKRMKISHSKEDFFEHLPDDLIIEHILPHLGTMKTVARLSMVSRRFRRLCVWTPNVDFSDQTTITEEIASYLDKFFNFRINSDHKYDITRLNLRDTKSTNFKTHREMINWIQHASSLNLEELFIERWPHSVLKLPFVLFPSKSLRILSLDKVDMDENFLRFDDWLLNCECLEELYLKNMKFLSPELKINSSSLRVLSIVADASFRILTDDIYLYPSRPKLLQVSAPKLRKLHIVFKAERFADRTLVKVSAPSLENFSLIKGNMKLVAELDISYLGRFESLQSATIIFSKKDRVSFGSMVALLLDISLVKSLQVNVGFIRKCSHPALPISLDKLEQLHINFSIRQRYKGKRSSGAVMSFLEKLPSLKTLKLTSFGSLRRCCGFVCPNGNPNDHRDQQKFLRSLECDSSKFGISKLCLSTEANLAAEIELHEGKRGKKLALHVMRHAPKDSQVTILFSS